LITDDDIRRVREATDIVALIAERVVLRQKGRDFWGNCPFHNEKTPSFKVDTVMQRYKCFGCGEGGSAFDFVMKTEGLEFLDAVRSLAQRANIELEQGSGDRASRGKKARLLEVCEQTAQFYHQQLMRARTPGAEQARGYLSRRQMGGKLPAEWTLGYAPGHGELVRQLTRLGFSREEMLQANVAYTPQEGSNRNMLRDRFFERVIFPIRDLQGRVIAFGGRVLEKGEPKYLNSADTQLFHKRDNLYAIDKAKAPITASGAAIVVEGYTDVIAMHAAGFANSVATLGTALTPQHLKLLSRFTKKVLLLFDGDEAGQRAADRAAELISVMVSPQSGGKADVYVALLPGAQDPADFCAGSGPEAMRQVLANAIPLLRFALDRRLAKWDLLVPEQRNRALADVVQLLVPVKGTLLAVDYLNYLADVFTVDYQTVLAALNLAKPLPGSALADGGGVRAAQPATAQPASTQPPTAQLATVQPPTGQPATAQQPAGQHQQAAGPAATAAAANHPGSQVRSYECELLRLYIEEPTARAYLRTELPALAWSEADYQQLAEQILALNVDAAPAALLSELESRMPAAANLLTATRLSEFAGVEPGRLARQLVFAIREKQLKARIRQINARLRQLAVSDRELYDRLFAEVAGLQQELADLRRDHKTDY
jgi:DNA primase